MQLQQQLENRERDPEDWTPSPPDWTLSPKHIDDYEQGRQLTGLALNALLPIAFPGPGPLDRQRRRKGVDRDEELKPLSKEEQ